MKHSCGKCLRVQSLSHTIILRYEVFPKSSHYSLILKFQSSSNKVAQVFRVWVMEQSKEGGNITCSSAILDERKVNPCRLSFHTARFRKIISRYHTLESSTVYRDAKFGRPHKPEMLERFVYMKEHRYPQSRAKTYQDIQATQPDNKPHENICMTERNGVKVC